MNKVVIIGRPTKDPELKFAQGTGTAVTTFTLAVNRRFKKEGQPDADFIPVVVFGKTAEATANYSAKGKLISIAGHIQTRNYEGKDGTRHYVTEVLADEVEFIEWASKGGKAAATETNIEDLTQIDDGDIPF